MSETPSRKPRHALSDTGPSVPVQHGPWDGAGADVTPRASVPEQAVSPEAGDFPVADRHTAVPEQAPAGDRPAAAPDRAGAPGDPGDAPTQALPVIPRPRTDGTPSVARLPEPIRPGPVREATAGAPRVPGLPDLPSTVRPVLPAALGAATALLLTLGVVAGVNGAPDPAPAPPAPVSEP
ncbi:MULTISPECIES: hypothetical protein [Pseudonocardia]|uniref:Uncharacterized protein n=2 Tax=Pseudonocardia TaxID=1847 RepID=A0A1Y2MN52_PSEAH|nr:MULTISPECIES: hypothetical protein [Pseudonocardia]OSY35888.1 hypothetical protein BG845_05725 [Pseudonocardia autotrophica]TDN74003.1 hypothetical protein C8E95_3118 [Pseudonocardia autotrophica]BBG04760.1 hypothetical protein Pdca_59690 [Pseudonocardia autotrophica]GEC28698.1 hypothetical protein PSA01_57270 [Pseudonocardia saturnea]